MAFIKKQTTTDSGASSPALLKGELGYDDYTAGGDSGRVYVGDGTTNIALSKKSEVDLKANTADVDTALGLKADKADVDTALGLKADKANPTFTGLITEEVSVSTLTLGATSSVQTYTATADFTIVDDLVSGESVTLILTNGGFTPTYPTMTWWEGAEPTLGTTDKLFFEKIGSTLWGSQVASLA